MFSEEFQRSTHFPEIFVWPTLKLRSHDAPVYTRPMKDVSAITLGNNNSIYKAKWYMPYVLEIEGTNKCIIFDVLYKIQYLGRSQILIFIYCRIG